MKYTQPIETDFKNNMQLRVRRYMRTVFLNAKEV